MTKPAFAKALTAWYVCEIISDKAPMNKNFWICNILNNTTAEMLLYGFIGEYEAIDDAAFITDLRNLEAQYATINIRVNCGGGNVYSGLAIFNAIRNCKAKTVGFIDGIAASMGAICVLACDEKQMSKYARYMTHRVTGFNGGNADSMRLYAEQLEQLENTLSTIIAEQTGLTQEEAKAKYITDADRWIGAEQALTEKLIQGIYDAAPVTLPETEADPLQLYNAYHSIFNISQPKNEDMKAIALLLGLPENATEAEITTAIGTMKTAKENAENATKLAVQAKAKALVTNAIANKQLVETDRAVFEPLAEANYEAAEAAIAKIPVAKKPNQVINMATQKLDGAAPENTEADNWENLLKQGNAVVAACKKDEPLRYRELYKAHYGFEPVIN